MNMSHDKSGGTSTPAPLGDSSSVKVGDTVIATGNAGGTGGTPSSTTGKVTAVDQSGSPAARAGLQAGDQLTSISGHQVSSPTDVQDVLGGYHPGDKISITWTSQTGKTHTATVTLATGPAG